MKRENRALLFLVNVGMELSWLYPCTNFLTTAVLHQSFPFPEAVGSFLLAATLTLFSEGRGWRVIYVVALQAFGFIPFFLRMVNVFSSWSYSLSSQTSLLKSPDNPVGLPLEYIIIFLLLTWISVFWAGGFRLAKRPTDYFTMCSRFERGLLAFFLLLLTKFFLKIQGGINVEESMSEYLLFPFLIFSLLAIGLVRNRSAGPRDFLPGYQGIGVILSFIVVILLFGTGLVLFCLPYLTLAAETGYGILKIAARPIGSFLLMVIRLIFGNDFALSERPPVKKKENTFDPTSLPDSGWWIELLGKILVWGVCIIVGLVLLSLLVMVLYCLYQWLFSKTSIDQERQGSQHLIALWAEKLRLFLHSCWKWLVRRVKGYKGAVQFYSALLGWGRHSGLRHIPSETPKEYGLRLKHRFPSLKREIELIIEAFNQEVYGEMILNEQQLGVTKSAWRRLRSPLKWPSRLKTWFIRPINQS